MRIRSSRYITERLLYAFDAERLNRAIAAAFERRGSASLQDLPGALTPAFSTDAEKRRQWEACAGDLSAEVPSQEVIVFDLVVPGTPRAFLDRITQRWKVH